MLATVSSARSFLISQSNTVRWCFILSFASVIAGCSSRTISAGEHASIIRVLEEQDRAWNRGDIDEFMAAYWRSPDLTFSAGGKTVRGWEPTRARYLARYPDRQAMGTLSFSDLEITGLGPKAALVLGRWHLERDKPAGGSFSLVMRKLRGQWLIVHDHTSSDAP